MAPMVTITSIKPAKYRRGNSYQMIIDSTGFLPTTTFVFSGTGVTCGAPTFSGDSLRAIVPVTITRTAQPSFRELAVLIGGMPAMIIPRALRVLKRITYVG